MSNTSIALKLEAGSHPDEGARLVARGNTWSSTSGGWLPNSGTWVQSVDGVRLKTSDGRIHAFCEALIFATCNEGNRGNGHYPQIADAGHWEVVGTS